MTLLHALIFNCPMIIFSDSGTIGPVEDRSKDNSSEGVLTAK